MGDAPRPARARAAFLLGLAALASSWTPVSAPFGLVVGVAALLLAVRALRRGAHRRSALLALALGAVAAVSSAVVVAKTAGAVTTDLPGRPVAKARSAAEVEAALDAAAVRTRAERERARREILQGDKSAPAPDRAPAVAPTPAGGGAPARKPGRSDGK